MITTIQLKRGISVVWDAVNPTLKIGEPGYATDKKVLKIGDGITAWNDLEPYGINEDTNPTSVYAHRSLQYNELKTLKDSSQLVPGQKYILSDYTTKHIIPHSNPPQLHTGATEPLVLTALTQNTFENLVISTLHPSDIIHYDFDKSSCEDGTRNPLIKDWVGGTFRPGWITYRKSTTNLLSTNYDWRNYKIRRWKLDCTSWVSGASYDKRSVAKGADGDVYVARKTHSGLTDDPSVDKANWMKAFKLSIQNEGAFLSYTSDKNKFLVGGILPDNLVINNNIPGTDYQDYYTFCILDEPENSSGIVTSTTFMTPGFGHRDISIGLYDYDQFSYMEFPSMENNVFYIKLNGSTELFVFGNRFDGQFSCNTFYGQCNSNTCSYGYYMNISHEWFAVNTFGPLVYKNSFVTQVSGNKIIENCLRNVLGGSLYNSIGSLYDSMVGDYMQNNTVSDIGNCSIGDNFERNIINERLYNQNIKDNFQANVFVSADIILAIPTFENATHVYERKTCTIFNNPSGNYRLSYYDDLDNLIVVSADS
ncbi:MAG TPA: hypothetical protein VFC79_02520 [Tissierellaceae bacterium]|nr:hypothetical protein [Tissierellaceae bacterium]